MHAKVDKGTSGYRVRIFKDGRVIEYHYCEDRFSVGIAVVNALKKHKVVSVVETPKKQVKEQP